MSLFSIGSKSSHHGLYRMCAKMQFGTVKSHYQKLESFYYELPFEAESGYVYTVTIYCPAHGIMALIICMLSYSKRICAANQRGFVSIILSKPSSTYTLGVYQQ